MRVLITGVGGFVGGHLSNLLLKEGYQVFGLEKNCTLKKSGVTIFEADITDKKSLSEVIKKVEPNLIFHLAAISAVQICKNNHELTKNVNVEGTKNLMLTCVENKINPRILITSSAHVYGLPSYLPLDENHPTKPVNEYGLSKLEQEKISQFFFKEFKLNIIIARSFNHIGPNQNIGFVCSDLAKQIVMVEKRLVKPEIRVGDLNSKRDFTDVRDIVKAYVYLINQGEPGQIYNIGSGFSYSIKKILEKLIYLTKTHIKVIEDKSLFRSNEIPDLTANNKKFVNLTGWQPSFNINQSLKDILDYWRSKV